MADLSKIDMGSNGEYLYLVKISCIKGKIGREPGQVQPSKAAYPSVRLIQIQIRYCHIHPVAIKFLA